MSVTHGGFTSDRARNDFLTLYERLRALGPAPAAVHDLPTDFGMVRAYRYGPERGVPVVLVHGFFMTSAMWWAQTSDLATDFTVYTLDMPGQPGASMQTAKMSGPAEAALCLDAVLAGLGLRGVHLVGHSYGGWLATHTAALRPERVVSLTLIDPAHTVVRLSGKFWRSLAVLLARPHSIRAERAASWITGHPPAGSDIDVLRAVFLAGFDAFALPVNTPPLRFPGDRLLRSVGVPTQVLLAGRSIHNADRAIRHIQDVAPHWRVRLWPDATHALPAEKPGEVNACIRQFARTSAAGDGEL